MLRYEFVRCMDVRSRLEERVKGKIFVGKKDDDITISIFGCPTCRYQVKLNEITKNRYITAFNIDEIVNDIYNDYKRFIQNRFFN